MYKKKLPTTQFKQKKMIINGTAYNVDSLETLNKIRTNVEVKRKEDNALIEEQKNQKVLVTRTRTKDNTDKVVKIIRDADELKQIYTNKEKQKQRQIDYEKKLTDGKKMTLSVMPSVKKKPLSPTIQIITNLPKSNVIDDIHNDIHNDDNKNEEKPKVSIIRHDKPLKEHTDQLDTIISEKAEKIINLDENPKPLIVTRNTTKIKILTNRETVDNNINDNINDTINDNTESVIPTNLGDVHDYFNKRYDTVKSQWYIMVLKAEGNGMIKMIDDYKRHIMPTIKFNNDMFLYKRYDNYNEYRIYFYTLPNTTYTDVHAVGITVKDIKLQQTTFNIVAKSVDVWKFRKLYDLEFIKYYMSKIKLNCTEKFIERFDADYELYKNETYFDTFIQKLKLNYKINDKYIVDGKTNVLYLVYSTMEYESYNYTVRTHNLIKYANGNNKDYNIYCVSRYGYPHDREPGYFSDEPQELVVIDGVTYIKLLNGTDNFNMTNILDYLKKYIMAVIKLAIETNAQIIHACGNYWNGIACMYASKYLNIKSVYEVRSFGDENITVNRPEIKNSDMVKMMIGYENRIIDYVDKVVAINDIIKDKINQDKVCTVNHGVDTDRFVSDDDLKVRLRDEFKIKDDQFVIGYIGSIVSYEGIDLIIKALKQLSNAVFVLIGDGPVKNELIKLAEDIGVKDQLIYHEKVDYSKVHEYYNLFDVVCYPKRDCPLCHSVGSHKLLEAMSTEKPVIITNLESVKDIVVDNENGLLIDGNDIETIVERVNYVINNPFIAKEIGKKAREFVINNRDWKYSSDQLIDIYKNLIKSQ